MFVVTNCLTFCGYQVKQFLCHGFNCSAFRYIRRVERQTKRLSFLLSTQLYHSMLFPFLPPLLSLVASVQAWDSTLLFQQELQNQGLTQFAKLLTTINQTTVGQGLLAQIAQGNLTIFAPTDEASTCSVSFSPIIFSNFLIAHTFVSQVANVSSQVSGNTTLFAEYLSYHFVHGNFENLTSSANGSCTFKFSHKKKIANENFNPFFFLFLSASTTSESSTSTSSSYTPSSATALRGRLFRRRSDWSSSSVPLDSGIYPNITLGRTFLNASEFVKLPGNNSQVLAWTRSGENGNVTILNQVYVISLSFLQIP